MRYNREKSWVHLPKVNFPTPDPKDDFRTYERVSDSLRGVHGLLEEYRSNEGRVGHAIKNTVMRLTKAAVAYEVRGNPGDVECAAEYRAESRRIVGEYHCLSLPDELAAVCADGRTHPVAGYKRDRFSDMMYQEIVESELHVPFWLVIIGELNEVPELPTVSKLDAPVQSILGAWVDLVSELAKGVDAVSGGKKDAATGERIDLFGRYLKIAGSIQLCLHDFKGFTPAVVNNSFGRGQGFKDKLYRQVDGTISRVNNRYEEKLDARQGREEMLSELLPGRK